MVHGNIITHVIIRGMNEKVFRGKQVQEVIRYVREEYGGELEFLWEDLTAAVWRNGTNRKWYGLVMKVAGRRLGLPVEGEVEILDLRFEKGMAREFAAEGVGILPGYHMNKNNWITVVLDYGVGTAEVLALLDQSYRLVAEGK